MKKLPWSRFNPATRFDSNSRVAPRLAWSSLFRERPVSLARPRGLARFDLIFRRPGIPGTALGLAALCAVIPFRLSAKDGTPGHYLQTNLVSDVAGMAATTDPNLVNPWGLARSATSPWWVADNGTGLSTLYNGNTGAPLSLVVTIPSPAGVTGPAAPTGTVFNGTATDFLVGPNQPAHFLFATEEGTISGWNSGTSAVLEANPPGAVFKGLTLAQRNGANRLYAADFGNGTVDVFDASFKMVSLAANAFKDPRMPAGYAPFGIQNIGGSLFVTFAKKQAGSIDEVHGPGLGFVDVFSSSGTLMKRLQWGSWFNAPWGLTMTPAGFGRLSNLVLVGQFGSGKIAAFDPSTGRFRGLMRAAHGRPLMIDGLWALYFGNGASAGPATTLFFTAGIDDEAHGLFGTITPLNDGGSDQDDGD